MVRAIVAGLVGMLLLPAAVSAHVANAPWRFDGVEILARCFSSPFGDREFEFDVTNRRPTSIQRTRLDVFFEKGVKPMAPPGPIEPWIPSTVIAGRHVWRSFESLNVYSGFAVQAVVNGAARGPQRVAVALTIEGRHRTFPPWTCTPPPRHRLHRPA